jgi:FixJ family two-component response regulator
VILSDVMMPGMSGMDLHAELTRQHPDAAQRMVFITGGVFTKSVRRFLEGVRNERMDKPFDAARVRALVTRFIRE